MSRKLWLCIGLCIPLILFAQKDSLDESAPGMRDLLNIKVDYANLFNPIDPTFLLSVEYFLRPTFSLTQEVGYINQLPNKDYEDGFTGIKLRQEFRHYLEGNLDENTVTYISANLMYRYLRGGGDYIVGYGCNAFGRGCEYYQNLNGSVTNHRFAALVRFGLYSHLTDRIILELDYGAGVRYNHERAIAAPPDGLALVPLELLPNHNGLHPYFTLSCKAGILLFRRKED